MEVFRFASILLYVSALTMVSWYFSTRSWIGMDDANIYFVYMRNFAGGHGFVYNIGGERVEGFTSLLWTLIGSIFYLIDSNPEKLLLTTNIALISIVLYAYTRFIDSVGGAGRGYFGKTSILFLAVIGLMPGFIDWTVLSLMETGLFCSLISFTALKIVLYGPDANKGRHYGVLSLLLALLLLCRPESMLIVPCFVFLSAVKEYSVSNSSRTVIGYFLLLGLFSAATLGSLVYWRMQYFGFPLPNTYYAKVSASRLDNIMAGLSYLYRLAMEKPLFLFILLHSAWYMWMLKGRRQSTENTTFYTLFILQLLCLAIPLYSGGDHFKFHRFILPYAPIILLLWLMIMGHAVLDGWKTVFIIVIAVFFSNAYNIRDILLHKDNPLRFEWSIATSGRRKGETLNKFFERENVLPSQGVMTAGGMAYAYKGRTIDLLGLNDTQMAHADPVKDKTRMKNHASFNVEVFFKLKPDVFWYEISRFISKNEPIDSVSLIPPDGLKKMAFKNIHTNRKFKDVYGYYRIIRPDDSTALQVFVSRDYAASLDSSRYRLIELRYE